jgi:hypothetical protein
VTPNCSTAAPEQVAEAERLLGTRFPRGYADFVTRFGEGDYCTFVRVYLPGRIVAEYQEEFQQRWSEYFFWDKGRDVLPRDRVAADSCCGARSSAARYRHAVRVPSPSGRLAAAGPSVSRRRYVARGVPGGWRIWDNKARRWWGDQYEVQPDDLVAELNGAGDYTQVTALLRRYRATKR